MTDLMRKLRESLVCQCGHKASLHDHRWGCHGPFESVPDPSRTCECQGFVRATSTTSVSDAPEIEAPPVPGVVGGKP